MRDYRFRGLTKEGEWVEGHYCVASKKHLIISTRAQLLNPCGGLVISLSPEYYIGDYIEVVPETVGQHTGLHDKNGREIFEGDIIDLKNGLKLYKVNDLSFYIDQHQHLRYHAEYGEVIGNIHENPELLEDK